MKTKIGIGIISFAHGHANAYCNQMKAFDDVQLIACWDDNSERGEAAGTQYGMNYSPHLEDVINHPEIHAVIVTCETNRHANVPRAADAVALKLWTRDEPSWEDLGIPIPEGHGERIAGVPRPFIDCLKNDADPDVTVEDGRVSVEMILGAYRSAQEGQRVNFPL